MPKTINVIDNDTIEITEPVTVRVSKLNLLSQREWNLKQITQLELQIGDHRVRVQVIDSQLTDFPVLTAGLSGETTEEIEL